MLSKNVISREEKAKYGHAKGARQSKKRQNLSPGHEFGCWTVMTWEINRTARSRERPAPRAAVAANGMESAPDLCLGWPPLGFDRFAIDQICPISMANLADLNLLYATEHFAKYTPFRPDTMRHSAFNARGQFANPNGNSHRFEPV